MLKLLMLTKCPERPEWQVWPELYRMTQVTRITRITQVTRRTGCQEASQTIDRMVYLKLHLLTLDQDQNIIVQMQWHSTSALIIWQGIIYMDLVMMRGAGVGLRGGWLGPEDGQLLLLSLRDTNTNSENSAALLLDILFPAPAAQTPDLQTLDFHK